MDRVVLWKNLGTLLVIAGIALIAYAGGMFRRYGLYAFILLRREANGLSAKAPPGKKKKKTAVPDKKPSGRKEPAEFTEDGDGKTDALDETEALSAEADGGPAQESGPGPAASPPAAESGTVLLTDYDREAAAGYANGTWMEPSEGFYIKKSIVITHTDKMISKKGESE